MAERSSPKWSLGGGVHVEIRVMDSDKIVEIWLTNSEKNNLAIHSSLKPLYAAYRAKKYKVAVFQSGDGNLLENTSGLLLHNRMI